MTLRLTLKPGEVLRVGRSSLTVVSQATCTVLIDGGVPILRQSDCVVAGESDDPVMCLRMIVQELYLDGALSAPGASFYAAIAGVLDFLPGAAEDVRRIHAAIDAGSMWEAVKLCKRLHLRSGLAQPSPAQSRGLPQLASPEL